MMKKIYVYLHQKNERWGEVYCALAEDGDVVAQHVCSSVHFMQHDMGFISNWKHEEYNAHFGEGNWELEWVDDIATHEGYQAALAKNRLLSPAPAKEEGE